jgi:hypothetical protein
LKSRKKWIVVAAMAGALASVLLLAGIVGGIVYYGATSASAQETEPTPPAPGDDWRWGGFGWGCGSWTLFDSAAEALGLTPNELFVELHDEGKSLSEIAEEQGVDTETLQDAMNANRTEAMRERIQQAVEDGNLSQDQADWLLEGLDNGFMGGGRGGMMGFGGGFGRGHGFGRGF